MARDFRTDNFGGRANLAEVTKIDTTAVKKINNELLNAGSIGGDTEEIIKKCNTMSVAATTKVQTTVDVLKNIPITTRVGSMGQILIDLDEGKRPIQLWVNNENWRDGNAVPGSGKGHGVWDLLDYIDNTYFKIPANKIFK